MNYNQLNPQDVWKYFKEISDIPRCSDDEQRISDYLVNFAKERNLEVRQDEALNVIIKQPATEGYEDRPVVALQAHMDMVCVKENESDHNFDTDPIELIVDGEWVRANGTTLGADDGMGVAYILAVLDDKDLAHGPLEAIITTGEETSMVGANAIDLTDIKAKYLLNIDSEEDGILTIGCAGGLDLEITWDVELEDVKGDVLKLELSDFEGGHSGMEIDKARLNTIKTIGRLLVDLDGLQILDLEGGVKRNAIASTASIVFSVADGKKAQEIINGKIEDILNESKDTDPNGKIVFTEESYDGQAIKTEISQNIINALFTLPDGLYKKHEGELITSSNLGILEYKDNVVRVSSMIRSQIDSAKENRAAIAIKIVEQFGANAEIKSKYSGWQREETVLTQIFDEVWTEQNGSAMDIGTTHGGLECGLFKGTIPHVEMISFGPEIQGAHSPAEKADIKSVEKNYALLKEVLKRI